MSPVARRTRIWAGVLLMAMPGCGAGDAPTDPGGDRPATPSAVRVVSGEAQSGVVATELPRAIAVHHAHTETGEYRLRGSYLHLDLFDRGASMLVAVERLSPELPSEEELRRAFGLSQRQSRVAQLLAGGRTNAEIARLLYVSPHTARHHTEHIFEKLGVRSRPEARTKILGHEWEGGSHARGRGRR
jgi:DNA-binding CsgD family transcriptional regulator